MQNYILAIEIVKCGSLDSREELKKKIAVEREWNYRVWGGFLATRRVLVYLQIHKYIDA